MLITSWSSLIFVGFLFTAKASKGKQELLQLNQITPVIAFFLITENIKYINQRLSIYLSIYNDS